MNFLSVTLTGNEGSQSGDRGRAWLGSRLNNADAEDVRDFFNRKDAFGQFPLTRAYGNRNGEVVAVALGEKVDLLARLLPALTEIASSCTIKRGIIAATPSESPRLFRATVLAMRSFGSDPDFSKKLREGNSDAVNTVSDAIQKRINTDFIRYLDIPPAQDAPEGFEDFRVVRFLNPVVAVQEHDGKKRHFVGGTVLFEGAVDLHGPFWAFGRLTSKGWGKVLRASGGHEYDRW